MPTRVLVRTIIYTLLILGMLVALIVRHNREKRAAAPNAGDSRVHYVMPIS
jgi:hypothetical protein